MSQSENYARRVLDLELQVDKKRGELSQTQTVLQQYGDNLKELELQFERRELEMSNLRQHNIQLKEALDQERLANANVRHVELELENERKTRSQAEKDLERLRDEMYEN